jgi:hypothetical protein
VSVEIYRRPLPRGRGSEGCTKAYERYCFSSLDEGLTIIFHIIRDGSVYKELGATHYDQQNMLKVMRRLVERRRSSVTRHADTG